MASITIKIHLNSKLEIISNSNYIEKGPENINIKSKIITVNSNKTVPPYLFMFYTSDFIREICHIWLVEFDRIDKIANETRINRPDKKLNMAAK